MFRFSGVELPFQSRTDSSASVIFENRKYPCCLMRVISSLKFQVSLFEKYHQGRSFLTSFKI